MSTTHKETVRAWFQNMKEPAGARPAEATCGSAIAVAGWEDADGGLLLGDIDDALHLVRLRAAGVTHIINCAARPLPPEGEEDTIDSTHPHLRLRKLDAPGLDHYTSRGVELAGYLAFAATDSPTYRMADHFDEACRFIDEARAQQGGGPRRVLVHCQAGVSRSASVVLCYLMRNNEWTLRQAIEHVWQTRPFVLPNAGFFEQLLEVERQLFAI